MTLLLESTGAVLLTVVSMPGLVLSMVAVVTVMPFAVVVPVGTVLGFGFVRTGSVFLGVFFVRVELLDMVLRLHILVVEESVRFRLRV